MHRLILAGFLAGAFAVACTGGPATSPGAPTVPGVPTVPADAGAARTQLCAASGDASLSGLASQLDTVDANTDTAQLQLALGSVASNVGQLDVSADQATARDAALTAVQQVQGALADPSTLPQVASSAAGALRQLQTSIC